MADTKRTQTQILSLLADNTTGDISPQDIRDSVVSARANQGLGWEFLTETDRTEGDAQSIGATTRTKLECDGAGSLSVSGRRSEIGTASWDGTNHKFIPELGSAYIFRLTYKAKTASAAQGNYIETDLDIGAGGLGTGPVIWKSINPLIKGASIEHSFQFSIPLFAEDPFPTNGGTLFVESNVAITVWDIRIFFARIFKVDN